MSAEVKRGDDGRSSGLFGPFPVAVTGQLPPATPNRHRLEDRGRSQWPGHPS